MYSSLETQRIKNFFLSPFGIVLILFLLQVLTGVTSISTGDASAKIVHLKSLIESKWKSRNIIYPAIDLDEEGKLTPMGHDNFYKHKGKIKSVFPESISYFYFPFSFLPIEYIHYTNGVFVFFLLWGLRKLTQISNFSLFLLFFGTAYVYVSFAFSEYPIYLLLTGLGFAYSLRFLESLNQYDFAKFSFLLAVSVWLRLESFFIYGVLVLLLLYFVYKMNDFTFPSLIQKTSFGIFLFLGNFFLFVFYNYLETGNILGSRFSYNYLQKTSLSLSERFTIARTILFLDISQISGIKMGFFLISIFFLIILVWASFRYKQLSWKEKYSYWTVVLLSLIIPPLAPNAGYYLPARYISFLIFPCIFLFEWNLKTLFSNKTIKFFLVLSFSWSVFLIFISCILMRFDSFLKTKFADFFSKTENQIIFFTSDDGLVNNLNLMYFKTKSMLISSDNKTRIYEKILQEKSPNLFFIITDGKLNPSLHQESQERTQKLVQIANEKNYLCEVLDDLTYKNFHIATRTKCEKKN
ncbi:MAG: hypothetical protein N3A69_02475 [Leptospiraceae bacterium]|nr:hypothetical protein [Leptospiraceae bacterium]